MNWFELIKLAAGVQCVLQPNPKNPTLPFFSLYGNTFEIKDKLKALGFGFRFGKWSTRVDFAQKSQAQLAELGVDTSLLEPMAIQSFVQNIETRNQQKSGAEQAAGPQSPNDQILEEMKRGVLEALQDSSGDGKTKNLLNFIDQMIDKVANGVDEAAKSQFVQSFMKFASKFHNYSFGNMMLIFVQNPRATHVAGEKKWLELGRQVVDHKNSIAIIAPRQGSRRLTQEQLASMTPDQQQKAKSDKFTYYVGARVWDISATIPIEGHKNVFEPKEWRQDDNTPVEEISALVNAAVGWGKAIGIDTADEQMSGSLGGYSAGGKVRINDKFEGVNRFSTTIHELAHEVLHHGTGMPQTGSKAWDTGNKQEKEIDAETTAYIVLQHYGFNTPDTTNYLALWKATGADVKRRRDMIHKAVRVIVNGIDQQMQSTVHDDGEGGMDQGVPEQGMADQTPVATASSRWSWKAA